MTCSTKLASKYNRSDNPLIGYRSAFKNPALIHKGLIMPCVLLMASCNLAGTVESLPSTPSEGLVQPISYKPVAMVSVDGETLKTQTMNEYAETLGVHSAAHAVFKNGKLIHEEFKGEGVGPNSLFQGASLAKVVSSTAIVTLALREGISLDEDLTKYITSFDLSSLDGYKAPITLRGLLSHTSGANVGGFQGYPSSAKIPTNTEVVLGSSITNSPPVAFVHPQGEWHYSGGGYQIAQAFAEDVSGLPFAQLVKELVLDPVGMTRSTYQRPIILEGTSVSAHIKGQTRNGPVEGGWHNYPELATTGLWTTSEEYGKFLIALMKAKSGDETNGIKTNVATEILTVAGDLSSVRKYGLGIGIRVDEKGDTYSFDHHGKNVGYLASFTAFPEDNSLSIVLTNHPNGLEMSQHINRGVGESLGYFDSLVSSVKREPLSDTLRSQCLGDFTTNGEKGDHVSLVAKNDVISFKDEDFSYSLVHLGEGSFLHIPLNVTFGCSSENDRTVLSVGRSSRYFKVES